MGMGQSEFVMRSTGVTVTPTFTDDMTSFYVNMPSNNYKKTVNVTADAMAGGLTSFKVYDYGGKSYSSPSRCEGTLVINAPEGTSILLDGTVYRDYSHTDFKVYDGTSASNDHLLYTDYVNWTDGGEMPTTASTGSSMTIYYAVNGFNKGNLDLTVTLVANDMSLSTDGDIAEGQAGHYYVNMPANGVGNLDLDGTVSEFKVYDCGGNSANYKDNAGGYLKFVAPENHVIQLTGNVRTEPGYDYMIVYDGTNTRNAIGKYDGFSGEYRVVSTGNTMMLYFHSDRASNYYGLDLTAKLLDATTLHNISVKTTAGGSMVSNKAQARVGEDITLTASPASGTNNMLSELVIEDASHKAIAYSGGWWEGQDFTFKMAGENVTVTPTFTSSLTAQGGLYINMPKQGTLNVQIPAGVQSFKVYDDGGKNREYSTRSNGTLVLKAPEGYVLKLSGGGHQQTSCEFRAYDGAEATGTPLFNTTDRTFAIDGLTTTTTGQNLTLCYNTGEWLWEGLDLTVTLVSESLGRNIEIVNTTGGTVTSDKAEDKAKVNDVVTLTITPDEGYLLNDMTITSADGYAVNFTDCRWYTVWTGNSKTTTFTMPAEAVTVKPTFTSAKSAEDGLFIDMPKTGTKTVSIPAGVTSFKLYDDGGKDNKFSKGCDGTIVMTAPAGNQLKIAGSSRMDDTSDFGMPRAYYNIYNGTPEQQGDVMVYRNHDYRGNIYTISNGESAYVFFHSGWNICEYAGLDFTVSLVPSSLSYEVGISDGIENGRVECNKETAKPNDEVTLTLTPNEGYVLKSISVTDADGTISMPGADTRWGDAYYYSVSTLKFKVRASNVTVSAEFIPRSNLSVNIPETGDKEFVIPAGTSAFKVYDYSGEYGYYFVNDDGSLLLTAPEGYILKVSGNVKLYQSSALEDYLEVYDGNSTSARRLGRYRDNNGVSATSSTNQMVLRFVANYSGYVANRGGVYLTTELLPVTYDITYNLDEGTNAEGNPTTYSVESDDITLAEPTKTGYTFTGWTFKGQDTPMKEVTIAKGSTGEKTFTANWQKNVLELTEAVGMTTDISNEWKGKTVDICFKRTFEPLATGEGKASTVCLPFDLTKPSTTTVGTFYTFGGVSNTTGEYVVTMNEVTSTTLSAGTPYMFKPATTDPISFQNTAYTVPSTGFTPAGTTTDANGWEFKGTNEEITWPNGQTRLYAFAASNFEKSDGTALNDVGAFRRYDWGHANPFRCYLWAPAPSTARGVNGAPGGLPQSLKVVLVSANGETTGIGTLDNRTGEVTFGDEWYSLDGQKLDGKPKKKGLYINKGNKVIIK